MKSLTALIALSVALFKEDKKLKQVFASEDGNIFFDENRAKLHAGEKKIEYHKITRTDAVDLEDSNDEGNEVKADKIKELQALDLTTKNYQDIRNLVNYFSIPVSDQKAETLIAALNEYKQKLV
jgi:hypothetical protein